MLAEREALMTARLQYVLHARNYSAVMTDCFSIVHEFALYVKE